MALLNLITLYPSALPTRLGPGKEQMVEKHVRNQAATCSSSLQFCRSM